MKSVSRISSGKCGIGGSSVLERFLVASGGFWKRLLRALAAPKKSNNLNEEFEVCFVSRNDWLYKALFQSAWANLKPSGRVSLVNWHATGPFRSFFGNCGHANDRQLSGCKSHQKKKKKKPIDEQTVKFLHNEKNEWKRFFLCTNKKLSNGNIMTKHPCNEDKLSCHCVTHLLKCAEASVTLVPEDEPLLIGKVCVSRAQSAGVYQWCVWANDLRGFAPLRH